MKVVRTSMWAKGKGIYTDTPKTKTSQRVLRITNNIVDLLKNYKSWQEKYRAEIEDKCEEHDRLFTQWKESYIIIFPVWGYLLLNFYFWGYR